MLIGLFNRWLAGEDNKDCLNDSPSIETNKL